MPAYLAMCWPASTASSSGEGDDRIAQGPEVLLEGQAPDLDQRGQGIGKAPGARVQDDVLHTGLGDCLDRLQQAVQPVRRDHGQGTLVLEGQGRHLGGVVLGGAVYQWTASVNLGEG